MTAPRWPVQALHDRGHTTQELRRLLGGRGYSEAKTRGLTDRQADRIAIRLGHHPIAIWGWTWVTTALGPLEDDYLDGGWRQAWLWDHEEAA